MSFTLKNLSENLKVLNATTPKGCPPVDKFRSKIHHSDYRSTNIYSCANNPKFIPTDEILKTVKCKPEMPLYNQPRKGGNCGMKIVNNDRRKKCCDNYCPKAKKNACSYPHRDVNRLHENLRDANDPCGLKTRPLLICRQCGCTYRVRKSEANSRPCRPPLNGNSKECPIAVQMSCSRAGRQDSSIIYFQAKLMESGPSKNGANGESNSDKPECRCQECRRKSSTIRAGDHYLDCKCHLCKRRNENCPNRGRQNSEQSQSNSSSGSPTSKNQDKDWSNPMWSQCNKTDCECQPECECPDDDQKSTVSSLDSDVSQIQDEACQKVVILGDDGKPEVVPCHFCFVVDHSSPDGAVNSSPKGSAYMSVTGYGQNSNSQTQSCEVVYKNCSKRRKPVCCCVYCEAAAKHKNSLHGPKCMCHTCTKRRNPIPNNTRCSNSNRNQNRNANTCSQQCPPPNPNPSCKHGPLCTCPGNFMVPQGSSPQEDYITEQALAAASGLGGNQRRQSGEPNGTCPCHQFIPTNWERKSNCNGCPTTRKRWAKIPTCKNPQPQRQMSDREVGSFCAATIVRPRGMKSSETATGQCNPICFGAFGERESIRSSASNQQQQRQRRQSEKERLPSFVC